MRINSRNLFLAVAIGAFTLATSPSWASASQAQQARPGSQSAQPYQSVQPGQSTLGQQPAKSQMQSISGKIVKSGGGYALQASDGQEYQLSGASHAKKYVGQSVIVTGKIDDSSHTIQVQDIQPQ